MSRVRPAEPRDELAILAMLTAMHGEGVYRTIPLDRAKLTAFLTYAREDARHCILVYEAADGVIDGCYIGHLNSYFFSNEVGAWDLIFYVRPARRGSIVAMRLWQAFRAWAKANGARTIWPGGSTGVAPERTARFYRGVDLQPVGTVFFGRL